MNKIVKFGAILMMISLVTNVGAAEKKPKKSAVSSKIKTYTDPTTGMQFVWVPGGCYMMGDIFNVKNVPNSKYEKPVHEVCVDSFYMGKYEVTQSEWTEIMGSNPSITFGEKLPVDRVSWDDVQFFVSKLNEKSGKHYRIPTEAEWEYAGRSGGKKEKWAGTSDEKQLGDYAWYENNSGKITHPVGLKRPNGLGLYDMTGNADEWCSDWYNHHTYDDDFMLDKPRNPQGASKGTRRASRGGSWNSSADYARTAYRYDNDPGRGYNDLGIRLVLTTVP